MRQLLKGSKKAWNSSWFNTIKPYANLIFLGSNFSTFHKAPANFPVLPPTQPLFPALDIIHTISPVVHKIWQALSCLHSFVDATLCLE